jgi:hypothetical protein
MPAPNSDLLVVVAAALNGLMNDRTDYRVAIMSALLSVRF